MVILASYVLARYRFPGRSIVYYGIIASIGVCYGDFLFRAST